MAKMFGAAVFLAVICLTSALDCIPEEERCKKECPKIEKCGCNEKLVRLNCDCCDTCQKVLHLGDDCVVHSGLGWIHQNLCANGLNCIDGICGHSHAVA